MGGAPLAQGRLYECLTSDDESLREIGGLSEAGFAGFLGTFGMGGATLAQVRSHERLTSDDESLREIGSVLRYPRWVMDESLRVLHECLRENRYWAF